MKQATELEPCPFCGGGARRSTVGTNAWFGTGCDGDQSCPAHLRALTHKTQAEADAAWNRRTPPAAAELHRLHAENTALQSGYDAAQLEIASLQAEVAKYRNALNPRDYAGCVVWAGDYRVVRRVTEREILHCRDMESALNQVAGACIHSLANYWKKQAGETP